MIATVAKAKGCQALVNQKRQGYEVTCLCGNPAKYDAVVNSSGRRVRLCVEHMDGYTNSVLRWIRGGDR
jgi:hypothetical protein